MTNSNELIGPDAAEKLHEAAEKLIDAATAFATAIIEAVKRAAKVVNDLFLSLFKAALPKVYHLACHARKQRTRKKDRRRLWCEINRLLR